jgi:hypothetical protein
MAEKLSSPRTGRTLLPRYIFFFNVSGTHFCQRLSKLQGLVRLEVLGKCKMSLHRVSNPCPSGLWPSALTTRLPRAPIYKVYIYVQNPLVICIVRLFFDMETVRVYASEDYQKTEAHPAVQETAAGRLAAPSLPMT